MTIEQVYSNLCYYDDRNPDNNNEFIDMEELPLKGGCYCDNCFYGRTKLAEYILEILNNEIKK